MVAPVILKSFIPFVNEESIRADKSVFEEFVFCEYVVFSNKKIEDIIKNVVN